MFHPEIALGVFMNLQRIRSIGRQNILIKRVKAVDSAVGHCLDELNSQPIQGELVTGVKLTRSIAHGIPLISVFSMNAWSHDRVAGGGPKVGVPQTEVMTQFMIEYDVGSRAQ